LSLGCGGAAAAGGGLLPPLPLLLLPPPLLLLPLREQQLLLLLLNPHTAAKLPAALAAGVPTPDDRLCVFLSYQCQRGQHCCHCCCCCCRSCPRTLSTAGEGRPPRASKNLPQGLSSLLLTLPASLLTICSRL